MSLYYIFSIMGALSIIVYTWMRKIVCNVEVTFDVINLVKSILLHI